MGVRSVRGALILGAATMAWGLAGCGGGGGGGKEDPPGEVSNVPGEPTVTTAKAVHEACALFEGASTQVNLTNDPGTAPLIEGQTSYHVFTAEGPAGWTGYFGLSTGGGDVVFSFNTDLVALEGSSKPPLPSFIIGGGEVTPKESVAAPLECGQVSGAYRYGLPAGDYSVLINPTAWYQFGLVLTKVE